MAKVETKCICGLVLQCPTKWFLVGFAVGLVLMAILVTVSQ